MDMPNMYAHFLPEGDFDHTPCLVKCAGQTDCFKKPFKYYNMWGKSPLFLSNPSLWWSDQFQGTKMFRLVKKLKNLKNHLRQFNKDHFADIKTSTMLSLKRLESIQSTFAEDPSSTVWLEKEKQALSEYHDLQHACSMFLSQKAKLAWSKDGARNTKFFHRVIKSIFIRNQVLSVTDMNGIVQTNPQASKESVLNFYKQLLGIEVYTDSVNFKVIQKEVKDVFFSIPNHKAPGPDGYSSAFYKDSWDVIGTDVSTAVLDVFKTGKLLKQINATVLTLIPKSKRPTHVHQLRPIACCNVLYKCISKIICTRLAKVLPELISLNQGGFIKGRSIIENIMVCQDLVRLYSRKSCTPKCMFKVDLIKAYDSISWKFMRENLVASNFPPQLRDLIMECVSSATFSLAINGDTFGFFQGKRDDLLMFCKGNATSMMVLLRGFSSFSNASGLRMNPQKSCVYFNGVHNALKKDILSVSGFSEGQLPFKYLGVPITTGRLLKQDCAVLVDKIVERIRSLGAKQLSYAGRLILVSSVLSTMHSYWASMFVLAKENCVPKRERGLGLKDSQTWNLALIGKLLWWVSVRPNKLWVQWVHHVYLKDRPWFSYSPSSDSSWHWRKVCQVKDTISPGFVDGDWSIGSRGYTVKSCYNWLREHRDEVTWYKPIWCPLAVPKHSFVAWLISSQALMLKDSLFQYRVADDNWCCICALNIESYLHLFQDCVYYRVVLTEIAGLLQCSIGQSGVLAQINSRRWSKHKKSILTSVVLAAWYLI
ncbi:uncharacterized protein LOC141601738 [Silene latifolia]|uniref:uncharacterized protein LOC141601738 n=1 Tax=Silene latifolia TaxID=37657 RepID=UPI003D778AE4